MSQDLKQLIYEYLQKERLMALATTGEHIWIANLYYLVDPDLNLYFLSGTHRDHSQHIKSNPEVAVAIADSSQPFAPGQKGIQLYGSAKRVNVLEQLKWMAKMWNSLIATNLDAEKLSAKTLLDSTKSGVYKITPQKIKFFNTELWPEEQIRVLELKAHS